MRGTARQMISVAEAEVGYLEKNSNSMLHDKTANAGAKNYTKYGAWYGLNPAEWCAMFVSWCADSAGVGPDVIPRHASCSDGITKFKRLGRWHVRSGYEPKAGDIVYFTKNGVSPCHVGLVVNTSDSRIYTVEGNTSGGTSLAPNGGCVAEKNYAKSYLKILGYAEPKYTEEEMSYEEFTEFMKKYEAEKAKTEPHEWSAEARRWAEENGIIKGDETGMRYCSALTREEYIVMEHRRKEGRV